MLHRDLENSKSEKLVWSAHVATDFDTDDAGFHSVRIKAESNRLSFRTNKFRDIEYKFKGEFFKNGKDFAEAEKVLKGTLEKFVKGKKVAESTSDFSYFEPHCLH